MFVLMGFIRVCFNVLNMCRDFICCSYVSIVVDVLFMFVLCLKLLLLFCLTICSICVV